MIRRTAILMAVFSGLFVPFQEASAQFAVVQEPTLETFGVATSVSVPDRGRISLGGVGRSASSRSMYGPFRSGTNTGLSTQGSGLSVHVWIHDFAEMDRAILESTSPGSSNLGEVRYSPLAKHAFETLTARRSVRDTAIRGSSAVESKMPAEYGARAGSAFEGPSSTKLLDRARQAEADGKRSLALTYLRAARDQGSADAHKQIERLSRSLR